MKSIQKDQNMRKENESKVRSPLMAALLSFGATGLGHIYCGRLAKGLLLFSMGFAFAPMITNAAAVSTSRFSLAILIASIAVLIGVFFYAVFDSVLLARRIGVDYEMKEYNKWYIYLIFIIFSVSYPTNLSNSIRDHLLQAYKIPTVSMAPNILKGDYILLNKSVYRRQAPEIGDIVIFPHPNNRSRYYIKRIVALPGDSVGIKDGVLFINGKPLEYQNVDPSELKDIEKRIDGKVVREMNRDKSYRVMIHESVDANRDFQMTMIPNGYCFVLGDNRSDAEDSRSFGPVPLADLKGRTEYIYLPAESWKRFGIYRD